MAIPKPKRMMLNVYYLFTYLDKNLASNPKLHEHGRRCWFYQQGNADHDARMAAKGYCPCGNIDTSKEEDGA